MQSPICITWLLNVPSTVVNPVLWTCSGMMYICSYTLDILTFERYAALAISLQMISWSGNGVTSLTVLSFFSHRSKTVCSLLFLWYAKHWHRLMCHCRYPPLCSGVSLDFMRELFVEMLWAFWQSIVDMLLRIN